MADDRKLPPGFPGGHVPIRGDVTDDGVVKPRSGNGPMSPEMMRAAFGDHPRTDWGDEIRARIAERRRSRSNWWKKPGPA